LTVVDVVADVDGDGGGGDGEVSLQQYNLPLLDGVVG